jgi:hypothetical protein
MMYVSLFKSGELIARLILDAFLLKLSSNGRYDCSGYGLEDWNTIPGRGQDVSSSR